MNMMARNTVMPNNNNNNTTAGSRSTTTTARGNNHNNSIASAASAKGGQQLHHRSAGSSDLLIASASNHFAPMFAYDNEEQMYETMQQQDNMQQYHGSNQFVSLSGQKGSRSDSMSNQEEESVARRDSRSECIHSGHFMISEIDESEVAKVDESEKSDGESRDGHHHHHHVPVKEPEVDKIVDHEKCQEYTYGPIHEPRTVTIDQNLSRLLQCMTLAYEERKLVSPKWNTFKGLRLKLKDKIRLNNIIWRCWHMQYKTGKKPPVCQFATMTDVHNKPEAVLLEGKYWRRGQEAIKAEYFKWRVNYPYPFAPGSKGKRLAAAHRMGSASSTYAGSEAGSMSPHHEFRPWMECIGLDEDEFMNWDDNTVFSLLQPGGGGFGFPSQREIARSGFAADLIQPSLSQLQPPLTDFYDDDIFHVGRSAMSILPTLPEEQSDAVMLSSSLPSSSQMPPAMGQQQQLQQNQPMQSVSTSSIISDPFQVPSCYPAAMSNTMQAQQQQQGSNIIPASSDLLSMDYDPAPPTVTVSNSSRRSASNKKQQLQQAIANHAHSQAVAMYNNNSSSTGDSTSSSSSPSHFSQVRPNELALSVYHNNSANKRLIHHHHQQQQAQAMSNNSSSNAYNTSMNMYPQQQHQQLQSPNITVAGTVSASGAAAAAVVSDRNFAIPQSPALKSPSQLSRAHTASSIQLHSSTSSSSSSSSTSYSAHNSPLHHHHPSQHSQQQQQFQATAGSRKQTHVPFERSSSLPVYSKSSSLGSLPLAQNYSFTDQNNGPAANSSAVQYVNPAAGIVGIDAVNASASLRSQSLIAQLLSNSVARTAPMHGQMHQPAYHSIHQRQQQQHPQQVYQRHHSQSPSHQPLVRSNSFSPVSSATSSPSLTSNSTSSPSNSNRQFEQSFAPSNNNLSQSSIAAFLQQGISSNSPQQHPSSRTGSPQSFRPKFADDSHQSYHPAGSKRPDAGPVRKISSPARICSNHPAAAAATIAVQQANGYLKDSPSPSPTPSASSTGSAVVTFTATSASSGSLAGAAGGSSSPDVRSKTDGRKRCKEQRRVCHINAEQKRRCNIRNGFDTLRNILPSLSQSSNTKVSKAAMLQKAAEHVRQLKSEKAKKAAECQKLEKEIESLNQATSSFQSQLPATGAPVCRTSGQTAEHFARYVQERTHENWKFYVFSKVMEPMLKSFDASISTGNVNELCKSTVNWVDQSCSLVTLRKDVLQQLRTLSVTTSIMSNPSLLPDECVKAANSLCEK